MVFANKYVKKVKESTVQAETYPSPQVLTNPRYIDTAFFSAGVEIAN